MKKTIVKRSYLFLLMHICLFICRPRLGKPIVVEVKSSENIPYFVYTIVARGNILKSEYVDVPEGRKSHTIKFIPTFEMVPKASIYVHYVFDNNLRFEEKAINFEKQFENTVSH